MNLEIMKAMKGNDRKDMKARKDMGNSNKCLIIYEAFKLRKNWDEWKPH